jgi:hypothetical protein
VDRVTLTTAAKASQKAAAEVLSAVRDRGVQVTLSRAPADAK